MTTEEFSHQLDALVDGEQNELEVLKDDFIVFLEAWNKHPEKGNIVGEAQLNGRVIYRYKDEE